MPREQVYAIIAKQGSRPERESIKDEIAQQAAGVLADICDRYESEPEAAEDCFWRAILAAIQFGRRQRWQRCLRTRKCWKRICAGDS